jgi:hypothetical protein
VDGVSWEGNEAPVKAISVAGDSTGLIGDRLAAFFAVGSVTGKDSLADRVSRDGWRELSAVETVDWRGNAVDSDCLRKTEVATGCASAFAVSSGIAAGISTGWL